MATSSQWRHNDHGGVSNHQPHGCLLNRLDQRKHQSSASLAFVWGIHRDRWIPRTKGQLRGKCFHLMTSSWLGHDGLIMISNKIYIHNNCNTNENIEYEATINVNNKSNNYNQKYGRIPIDSTDNTDYNGAQNWEPYQLKCRQFNADDLDNNTNMMMLIMTLITLARTICTDS